ncbi:MAG TPA: RNB domain-containing ribonuclease [Candidatus Polarisedimenticolia bacterium]|nr:RNB domain-containing ribonuclease [Candidatus Polarisedimenticolia bacterium]
MAKDTLIRTGDVVDLFEGGGLLSAVVVGEERGRLQVITQEGQALSVTSSRIAHRAGPAAGGRPAEAAARHAAAAAQLSGAVDLPALWDVLADEPRKHPLASLAALALGDDSGPARSAVLRALHGDRTHFVRKGEEFEPRARGHVEEILHRQAAEKARAERREAFLHKARKALRGEPVPPSGREEGELVADLVELAVMGEESPDRRDALALLHEAGCPDGPPGERAFRLLRAMGVFSEDENLFIHRFGLRTAFPSEAEDEALRAAGRSLDFAGRADLRELAVFTIDDEQTTEMDDAVSARRRDGLIEVGVHIADSEVYVDLGGAVDREAMARAATFYFPDVKLRMLPAPISERAASLVEGEDRPALSFLATLSPLGELVRAEIVPSIIRSRARLSYDQADALMAGGFPAPGALAEASVALELLRPLCERLEAERVAAGAVIIRAAEVDIRVEEGEIRIRRLDDRGPSRRLVAELMILANRMAADFCRARGIPVIYRRQPPPLDPLPAPAPPEVEARGYDPVAVRQLRRRMRRGETSLQPAPHHGLGLEAYTQATSPIRRYQDLVVHRQVKAALRGEPLPHSAADVARIAATTEEAERAAREAERGTDEYWTLKHYERMAGRTIEGIVVAVDARRTEVELEDTLYSVHLPPRPDHRPGQRLNLLVEGARPRARRLTLTELPP